MDPSSIKLTPKKQTKGFKVELDRSPGLPIIKSLNYTQAYFHMQIKEDWLGNLLSWVGGEQQLLLVTPPSAWVAAGLRVGKDGE